MKRSVMQSNEQKGYEMGIHHTYRKLWSYRSVVDEIDFLLDNRGVDIDYEMGGEIVEMLSSNYIILEKKEPYKPTFLWRLTLVPFILFVVLMWVITPFKWLITGTSSFDIYSKKFIWYRKWCQRIGQDI